MPSIPRSSPPVRQQVCSHLSDTDLASLNARSDAAGWSQLSFHLAVIVSGGLLWGLPLAGVSLGPPLLTLALRVLGLPLLGVGLAFGFCAMHECGHRTAFADRKLNDAVAWWAGVISFYNADFYRRYHQWHHRYTQQPGLDPELEDAPPTSRLSYAIQLTGIPWWLAKIRGHLQGCAGNFEQNPYIPSEATGAVQGSIRRQLSVYAILALASIPHGNGMVLWLWILPLAIGEPLLRLVLMAEHGGCDQSTDGFSNTRTTLTNPLLRRLMWNMPFHAEHHLYPSLPFHALPRAHALLASALRHCDRGYLQVHRQFLADPLLLSRGPLTASVSSLEGGVG